MISINVAKEFTDTPGARYSNEGPYSGQLFRDSILEPKYIEAIKQNVKLLIDLDGGYGYATSFLEEAFGGLARKYNKNIILDTITLKSDDEPSLVNDIMEYVQTATTRK